MALHKVVCTLLELGDLTTGQTWPPSNSLLCACVDFKMCMALLVELFCVYGRLAITASRQYTEMTKVLIFNLAVCGLVRRFWIKKLCEKEIVDSI